jgi:hypothetical protein
MPNDMPEPNKQPRLDDSPIMSKKELKKKAYKERIAREQAEREVEREAKLQREMAQPEYPIREFCLGIGTMPWECASANWGYTNRDLNVAVPSPNDKLERVTGLVKTYDLASAVTDAAFNVGSGGSICDVIGAKLSADRTTLEVKLISMPFKKTSFKKTWADLDSAVEDAASTGIRITSSSSSRCLVG